MQNIKKILISLSIFLMLIAPAVSLAAGLVPCGGAGENPCNFNQLMAMINRVIKFILYDMVIPIAAIMFAYAGFLMVTAGEETSGARTKAKNIFTNTVLGLIFAVGAFIIIRTILSILGYEGSWIGFNPLT